MTVSCLFMVTNHPKTEWFEVTIYYYLFWSVGRLCSAGHFSLGIAQRVTGRCCPGTQSSTGLTELAIQDALLIWLPIHARCHLETRRAWSTIPWLLHMAWALTEWPHDSESCKATYHLASEVPEWHFYWHLPRFKERGVRFHIWMEGLSKHLQTCLICHSDCENGKQTYVEITCSSSIGRTYIGREGAKIPKKNLCQIIREKGTLISSPVPLGRRLFNVI